jgi:glycosyltransferase involved in cell wall biosynthesis
MRILFLSNFYPPASRGGYEQWCQEVLDGLRSRGHAVEVLTSEHGKSSLQSPDPAWVHRSLHLEMEIASLKNALRFFTHRKRREQENLKFVREFIEWFKPDVVLIWGMWNLHTSILVLIEKQMAGRVVYYMGDYWPTLPNQFENYWNAPPRSFLTGLPKLLLKPFAQAILAREKQPDIKLGHVLFPSVFMQNEFGRLGIVIQNSKVIYGAIDTSVYITRAQVSRRQIRELTLLCVVARLENEKGVHTAIEAVGQLVQETGLKDLKLKIVGGNGKPEYEAYIRNLVTQYQLESFIEFKPAISKEKLPALYQQADVFLFTSIWPEPFGRVIVEAMASGLTVVGAPVGGAAEILRADENALTFTPDDPSSLAQQLRRLIETPALRDRLAKAGRETAVGQFDLQRMTNEIESYLQALP